MLQKLLSHGNSPPPDPRGLRPEVSDDLTAIIHKMLAKNPADRYPRAIDVVADLRELAIRENLVRAQSRGTLTIVPSDPVPQFITRHLPWMVAATLVFAIAAYLNLSSAVGRNDFVLEPPPSAIALRRSTTKTPPIDTTPSNASSTPESLKQETAPNGTAVNAATSASTATQSSSGDEASMPPQYSALAIPAESPSTALTKTPEVPSTTTARVERVVIGTTTNDPAVRLAPTLSEALRVADEFKVAVIEIAVPVLTSTPVQINRDGLTIRSIVGGSEIRFVASDSISMQRVAMMDLGSNRIDLQDLHFTWKVRSSTIDGGCLFKVATSNRLVRMANCTITIENLAERDEVFAFEIASQQAGVSSGMPTNNATVATSPPSSDLSAATGVTTAPAEAEKASPEKPKSPSLVAIELKDVAARGEMTLVNLADAVQLEIKWQNGLLAVSRRMLEATGANVRPALGGNQIQISLEQVTAWTRDGFARMRLGPSGAYPMMIDRNCRRSVFHQNVSMSHIEITGLESSVTDPSQLIQLRGEDNAYDFDLNRDAVLLVLGQWNQTQPQVYRLSDVAAAQSPPWMTDRSPQWSVRWSSPVSTATPSRLTITDFLQDGTLFPGFDRNRLPTFPKLTPVDPEN